jgi:hypothetical protein
VRFALWGRRPAAERRSAPLERHSAPLAQHSALPELHSGPLERRHSGPDCRAVRAAAAAAYPRPQGVAVLPERARLSAAVLPPAQLASAERALRRPVQVASAEQARQRAQPEVLAEQELQREAQGASAQQAAAVPPEGRDASAVRLPAADAAGAVLGVEAAPQPEARRALVAPVRGAAAPRAWPVPGGLALPLAVLSALAFRPDRLRSVPAPQPAERFGRATTGLRIVSP